MKDVYRYIDHEILEELHKGLERVQYSRVACAIRLKTFQCLQKLLPLHESSDFYLRVLRSLEDLAGYFEDVCCEESSIIPPPCEEITIFRRTLQTYALTIEQLQLLYYRELIEILNPMISK